MKKRSVVGVLALLASGLIMLPQSIPAQHQHGGMQHPGHTTMGQQAGSMKGRIIEMTEGTIVVEGKHQGKVEKMTLMLDDKTKREGVLKPGDEIELKYRSSADGMFHATVLKGSKPKY